MDLNKFFFFRIFIFFVVLLTTCHPVFSHTEEILVYEDSLSSFSGEKITSLKEVIVKPKKQKYSKKNNPALDLMRKVRSDYEKHNPVKNMQFYSYDHYDKTILAINNFKGYAFNNDDKNNRKNKRITDFIDTAIWSGNRILDLSIKEKYSTRIITNTGIDKEIVNAQRSNGIDQQLDEGYTRALFDDFMGEVDVYANDIAIMRNRFVSPLSSLGPDFYKYEIIDTVNIGKDKCVELYFTPHNKESMGFFGSIFIPVEDSVKYVKRVMMKLPKSSNVNYVENLYLSQNFKKDSLGYTHKTLDDLVLDLHIAGKFGEFHVARQSRYDNFRYDERKDLKDYYSKIGNIFHLEDFDRKSSEYWTSHRMIPLSYAEKNLSMDNSPYKDIPILYWTSKIIELLVKGYVKTSKDSKFDIGPIDTFISYNDTEGLRLAAGGLTTSNLSDRLFARGYLAYGFKDHRWKYQAEIEYSFIKKKYHAYEYPINSLRLSYRFDLNEVGQKYMTASSRNLISSITRIKSNLTTYERHGALEYNIEWLNNLSLHASLNYRYQEAGPYVQFINGHNIHTSGYTENSMRLQLRWAPGEKFMQTYVDRHYINRDAWTFILSHEFGPKKLFGSSFTLNVTEFCMQKRLWFSAFGYADIIFKAGKLWSQVQFPSLLWQNANIAYTVQSESFSLLNPMEFAMDQFISLDLNYNMNGLIFNRIPLIKKLKLREVFTFKGFAGHLTKKNNPLYNDNLFRFPSAANTQPMGNTPYMEIGVGLDNILTILRIDYIWRLSYRNKPGAPNSGLRFGFHFAF